MEMCVVFVFILFCFVNFFLIFLYREDETDRKRSDVRRTQITKTIPDHEKTEKQIGDRRPITASARNSNTTHKTTKMFEGRKKKKNLRAGKDKHPVTFDWNDIIHPKPFDNSMKN